MPKNQTRSVKPNGKVVSELRREKGWTLEKLSEVSDVGVRTIQRIQRSTPVDMTSLQLIAEALGVDYAKVVSEAEPEPEPAESLTSLQMVFKTRVSDFNPEKDMTCIVNALRAITSNYFELRQGDADGQMMMTVSLDVAALGDLAGEPPHWARALADVGVAEIDFGNGLVLQIRGRAMRPLSAVRPSTVGYSADGS